jgi:hypothetical protein
MNRLMLLPFALPFACLAFLSLMALVAVVALAAAIHAVRAIKIVFGFTARNDEDPRRWAGSDAHPLEYIEAPN